MTEQQKERLKKWIAALRSGDYKQTKGQLRDVAEDGHVYYCCLGVACDIAAEELGGEWRKTAFEIPALGVSKRFEFDLPSVVRNHFGVPLAFVSDLAHMNDNQAADFAAIAGRIEDYLEGKP